MYLKIKCFNIYNVVIVLFVIWIWSLFLHSGVRATDQRMHQSVAESLSLSQNKRLLLYQTLWECLMCHYSNIYPLLPMNLSTDLSIRRQRNPLCAKKILFLVKLDMCHVWVAPSYLFFAFFASIILNLPPIHRSLVKILDMTFLSLGKKKACNTLILSGRQTILNCVCNCLLR